MKTKFIILDKRVRAFGDGIIGIISTLFGIDLVRYATANDTADFTIYLNKILEIFNTNLTITLSNPEGTKATMLVLGILLTLFGILQIYDLFKKI